MVYTELAPRRLAAVSCGTSHVSAASTPLRWISKKRAVKRITCERSESAQESGRIALYKRSSINQST